jgi:hypothetical protein
MKIEPPRKAANSALKWRGYVTLNWLTRKTPDARRAPFALETTLQMVLPKLS